MSVNQILDCNLTLISLVLVNLALCVITEKLLNSLKKRFIKAELLLKLSDTYIKISWFIIELFGKRVLSTFLFFNS